MGIAAVTFDFWDTLVIDDSDEPVRAAQGLATKSVARRGLVVEELLAHNPVLTRGEASAAWDQSLDWCRSRWLDDRITPTVAERVEVALSALGMRRTAGFDELVDRLSTMEVEIPPQLAPGVVEAIPELAKRFALGIISDTIVTPGVGLQAILRGYGLLECFQVFVFSDELGVAKPEPKVFQAAARGFGVAPGALAHVGDREVNDVQGIQDFGGRGVLYTGVVDRRSGDSTADIICADHRVLGSQLEAL
jgi:putative hydrolase of the HAD superfamily